MTSIRYWDGKNQSEETEQVYGDAVCAFFMRNRWARFLRIHFYPEGFQARFTAPIKKLSLSKHKIAPFIREFKIPMKEYEEKDFQSFNDFFIRKFKPGMRTFVSSPKKMAAFAEARYLAYEKISADQTFPVKGSDLAPEALIGRPDLARAFHGGSLLIARLCPLDYHRYHYPDDGRTWDSYRIHGALHSVNPVALKFRSDIFFTNERKISLLDTKNFGRIAYIEVGALCVGKIVQTHLQPEFKRGDEKGYFLFGASTVIVIGEPGAWKPAQDLLEQTAQKRETLVQLGEPLTD